MRKSFLVLLTCVLGVGLVARPAQADFDQDWFPAVLSLRLGVVHGPNDSFFSAGGSLAYQAGRILGDSGWFWTVGATGAYVHAIQAGPDNGRVGMGFLVGPEGRFGWAWGDWRRDVFVHLRVSSYFIRLENEVGQSIGGLGGRMAIGVGCEQGFIEYLGTPGYGLPNLLEAVVDFTGGGPFLPAFRVGILLGWEI